MQLDSNVLNRLIHAARRFENIERRFAEFRANLEWFSSSQCPLRQVLVELGDDSHCVIVSFGTAKVVFRLLLVLPEGGVAMGQVICLRASPKVGVVDPMIASFMFDAQGRTTFKVDEYGDPVEMGQHATNIVLHVLEMAVRPIER